MNQSNVPQILCHLVCKNFQIHNEDQKSFFTRVPEIGEKFCISGPQGGFFLVEDILHFSNCQKSIRMGPLAIVYCRYIGSKESFGDLL